jgi:hypothetical protein
MQNLVLGILYGILGQVGSFVQLQAALKYGWYPKYTAPLLLIFNRSNSGTLEIDFISIIY